MTRDERDRFEEKVTVTVSINCEGCGKYAEEYETGLPGEEAAVEALVMTGWAFATVDGAAGAYCHECLGSKEPSDA